MTHADLDMSWQDPMGSYVALNDAAFASYWGEWTDPGAPCEGLVPLRSPEASPRRVRPPYAAVIADQMGTVIDQLGLAPASYLEVGPGNGRFAWEVLRRTPSLRSATLLEPTGRLRDALPLLFTVPGALAFKVPFGGGDNWDVALETGPLIEAVCHVDVDVVARVDAPIPADVCIALNVLDQVGAPAALIAFLKASTNPGGLLAVSCTYQWQRKKLRDWDDARWNLHQYFDDTWRVAFEADEPYRLRVNERFHSEFLSHTLILRAPVSAD